MSVESMEKLKNSMLEIKEIDGKEKVIKDIEREKVAPFTQIKNNFLEDNECNNSMEVLLFIILKKFEGANGECNPSYKTLMKLCKCKRTAIIECLKHLELLKYIVVRNINVNNERKPNVYWLVQFDKWTGKIIFDSLNNYREVGRINMKKGKL